MKFENLSGRIAAIENLRVQGHTSLAHVAAKEAMTFDLRSLATVSEANVAGWLQMLRQFVDTGLSLYSQESDAERALVHLGGVRDAINKYYVDPSVAAEARKIKEIDGHEYYMSPEMWRDTARYNLRLFELFPNMKIFDYAIYAFERAVTKAPVTSSIGGLALMEKEINEQALGKEIRFQYFSAAYDTVKTVSEKEGNWDRLAVSSWWLSKVALGAGQPLSFLRGITTMVISEIRAGQLPLIHPVKDVGRKLYSWNRKNSFNHLNINVNDYLIRQN